MAWPAERPGVLPPPFAVLADPDRPGVLLLRGELDLAGAPALSWAVREVLGAPGDRLVLDLSELTFIDATGIRAVRRVRAGLEAQGAEVIVRGPQTAVRRVFGLCGLEDWLEAPDGAAFAPA